MTLGVKRKGRYPRQSQTRLCAGSKLSGYKKGCLPRCKAGYLARLKLWKNQAQIMMG